MKKYFWAVLTVLLCMTGCQNNAAAGQADTEQAASGSSETTTTVTEEQTSKSAETTTATTVTEELSEDIAVSREYEFDLDKYLERDRYEKYSLRNELEFLNDEQYDAYIRAWIFLDNLEYFNIPYTGDIPSHFLDESGEIRASYYDKETNTINPYMYISTYQSFYEYLQSVFTQDAVDKIMSHSFFKTVGDELYFRYGEKGGAIYFNGGEYNLIEKNDSEVIFEYIAHQKNDEKEWTETHPLKLVRTDNGWRSEFFENLYIETATSLEETPDNTAETVTIARQEFSVDESSITIRADLNGTDISNIKYLRNLKELNLVGDEGYSFVTGFSNISYLENLETLSINAVETDDMNIISECGNLKKFSLELNGTKDLSFLKDISSLEEIYICNVSISDITFIESLTNLKRVSIIEAVNLTDFESLRCLDNAEYLYISCNNISDEQLNTIKNSLPNCEVK